MMLLQLLLVILFVATALAAPTRQKFKADIIRYNKKSFNGYTKGVMYYDFPNTGKSSVGNNKWRIEWYPKRTDGTTAPTVELALYNTQGSEPQPIRYTQRASCCDAETAVFPSFHYGSPSSCVAKTDQFVTFPPSTALNSATSKNYFLCTVGSPKTGQPKYYWVKDKSVGLPMRVEFADGTVYELRNHLDLPSSTSFQPAGNNCPQPSCRGEFDLMYVIDESGSISTSEFNQMTNFAVKVLDKFFFVNTPVAGRPGIRCGVQKFSSSANSNWLFPLSENRAQVENFIKSRKTSGGTNIGRGMEAARIQFTSNPRKPKVVSRIMIVLTDGYSSDSARIGREATSSQTLGYKRIAVGVQGYNAAQLKVITSGDSKLVITVGAFSNIDSLILPLVGTACSNVVKSSSCDSSCVGFCDCGGKCLCPSVCSPGLLQQCQVDNGQCDPKKGKCPYKSRTCDDSNFCTKDSCKTTAVNNLNNVCNNVDQGACPGPKNCQIFVKNTKYSDCCQPKDFTCPPSTKDCYVAKCSGNNICTDEIVPGCNFCKKDVCKNQLSTELANNKCLLPVCKEGASAAECSTVHKRDVPVAQGGCDDGDPCSKDDCEGVAGNCTHLFYTGKDDPCEQNDVDSNTCTTHKCSRDQQGITTFQGIPCKLDVSATKNDTTCADGDYCTINKANTTFPGCCQTTNRTCNTTGLSPCLDPRTATCVDDSKSDDEKLGHCAFKERNCSKELSEDLGVAPGSCQVPKCTPTPLPNIKYNKEKDIYEKGVGCYYEVQYKVQLDLCKNDPIASCVCDEENKANDVLCPANRKCPVSPRADGLPPCACPGAKNNEPCGLPIVDRCGRCETDEGFCDNRLKPPPGEGSNPDCLEKGKDCWDTPDYCPCPSSGKTAKPFPVVVALAAGIGGGIIAAIVVAIIVVVAGVGGGVGGMTYYKKYKGTMGEAHTNPMFQDKPTQGDNPFYEEQQ